MTFDAMLARLVLLLLTPLLALSVLVWAVRFSWSVLFSPARAWKLAVAMDQTGNAALNGDMDRTISHRAGVARDNGRRWGCVLCRALDVLDPGHCNKSRGV